MAYACKLGNIPTPQYHVKTETSIRQILLLRKVCWRAEVNIFLAHSKTFLVLILKDPVMTLRENGKIVSDQSAVFGIMNDLYVNIAGDIGSVITPEAIEAHPV